MRILVADDDPVSRRLMQGILQRSGYEVILAEDGVAACRELAKNDGPRLALIDWIMPEMDGLAVCREVRRRRDDSYVYIALLTARQANEDIVAGLEAGADDYLTKPCRPAELKARLLTGRRILRYEDKLVEARETMRFRATHDALTGLWNRGSILSHLQSAISDAIERRDLVSVLLCDVDHFKEVNDAHGHLAGDRVLEEVSARLLGAVRKDDRVGRYGGEEFLILLEGCKAEDLQSCAEHVRRTVTDTEIKTRNGALNVSVSIGGATFGGWSRNPSVEHLVRLADEALYEAKARGRNCVYLIESGSVIPEPRKMQLHETQPHQIGHAGGDLARTGYGRV
jgi:two-component system cell cycle response regulator